MNDFESRARSAGRAAREAVEPAAELTTRALRRRRPAALVAVAAAAVIALVVTGVLTLGGSTPKVDPAEVAAFCRTLTRQQQSNSEADTKAFQQKLLDTAPPELHDDLRAMIDGPHDLGTMSKDAKAAWLDRYDRVVAWTQINCYPDAARPGAPPALRRYAPDPLPAGLHLCLVTNANPGSPPAGSLPDATIAVYGDASAADPYAGPVIAIAYSPSGPLGFVQDTAREIAGTGHPEAKTQQITDGAGTPLGVQAIGWIDGSANTAVLGRSVPESDLVAVSARLGSTGPPSDLAVTALGRPLDRLYAGSLAAVSGNPTYGTGAGNYHLVMGPVPGAVLGGFTPDRGGFEAIRLFYPRLRATTVAGKHVLLGPIDRDRRSYLARWQEADGVVVELAIQVGPGQESALHLEPLVAATRELDRAEWVDLIEHTDASCLYEGVSNGRSDSSSSSSGSSSISSSGTSATSLPVPATTVPAP